MKAGRGRCQVENSRRETGAKMDVSARRPARPTQRASGAGVEAGSGAELFTPHVAAGGGSVAISARRLSLLPEAPRARRCQRLAL
jgi:hypothetical protein